MPDDFNEYLASFDRPVYVDENGDTCQLLGDPRQYPGITQIKDALRDGDYALIVRAARLPVIYFMRPYKQNPNWHTFAASFDGEVLGANMIIDPRKRDNAEGVLRSWLEERFDLVRYNGRDMDGVQQPFFVFKSKSR